MLGLGLMMLIPLDKAGYMGIMQCSRSLPAEDTGEIMFMCKAAVA